MLGNRDSSLVYVLALIARLVLTQGSSVSMETELPCHLHFSLLSLLSGFTSLVAHDSSVRAHVA